MACGLSLNGNGSNWGFRQQCVKKYFEHRQQRSNKRIEKFEDLGTKYHSKGNEL
jgi:hypothetical protein